MPLLAKAKQAEAQQPHGIDYVLADVTTPAAAWAAPRYDLAVCNFGLSDIDDLDLGLSSIAAVLHADARFVFSILHPCFPGDSGVSGSWPAGSSYADEGWWVAGAAASSLRAQVGANHRTLATYVNALARAGFSVHTMDEPPPPPDWATAHLDAARCPVFLVAECVTVRPLR